MSSSVGMMTFPTEWKVIKFPGSKPPTSICICIPIWYGMLWVNKQKNNGKSHPFPEKTLTEAHKFQCKEDAPDGGFEGTAEAHGTGPQEQLRAHGAQVRGTYRCFNGAFFERGNGWENCWGNSAKSRETMGKQDDFGQKTCWENDLVGPYMTIW